MRQPHVVPGRKGALQMLQSQPEAGQNNRTYGTTKSGVHYGESPSLVGGPRN